MIGLTVKMLLTDRMGHGEVAKMNDTLDAVAMKMVKLSDDAVETCACRGVAA